MLLFFTIINIPASCCPQNIPSVMHSPLIVARSRNSSDSLFIHGPETFISFASCCRRNISCSTTNFCPPLNHVRDLGKIRSGMLYENCGCCAYSIGRAREKKKCLCLPRCFVDPIVSHQIHRRFRYEKKRNDIK